MIYPNDISDKKTEQKEALIIEKFLIKGQTDKLSKYSLEAEYASEISGQKYYLQNISGYFNQTKFKLKNCTLDSNIIAGNISDIDFDDKTKIVSDFLSVNLVKEEIESAKKNVIFFGKYMIKSDTCFSANKMDEIILENVKLEEK